MPVWVQFRDMEIQAHRPASQVIEHVSTHNQTQSCPGLMRTLPREKKSM